ncbi:hypothetical protein Bca52824_086937 [Brassica carinata]|uniref:Uncharacterized protein n=1 Tax=Brassica carinata TaxID=52824 RepID=A0A8X7PAR4_BRACI|nr:hypothetical protein Bca52824_086936 [Brassica carinata]KAG2247309.1 hypothetical protein Bca52824_086937 [Brassica carinata]
MGAAPTLQRWEALRTTPHHVQVQGLDVDDLTLVDIDVGGLHSTSLTARWTVGEENTEDSDTFLAAEHIPLL